LTISTSIHKLKSSFRSCDECSHPLVESSGYLVCTNCGLVHECILTQPWKKLFETYQLIETIHPPGGANDFTNLLKRLNCKTASYSHFNRYNNRLQNICNNLNLSLAVKLRAVQLFKKYCSNIDFYKAILNKSHIANELLFLSIYKATRENKKIVSIKQIFEQIRKYSNRITKKSVNILITKLNLSKRFTVYDHLDKLEKELLFSFPELVPKQEQVRNLAQLKKYFLGTSPRNFALACLYLVYSNQKKHGLSKKLGELGNCNIAIVQQTT